MPSTCHLIRLLLCLPFVTLPLGCGGGNQQEVSHPITPAAALERLFSEDVSAVLVGGESLQFWNEELLAWLEQTGPVLAVRPNAPEPLIGLGRVTVEATLEHPGGGLSTVSAQLRQDEQGDWRIIWLRGPAGSWPPH